MSWIITNGSLYIRTGSDNRPTTTKSKEDARKFDTRVKAENVCVCLPGAYRNLGFFVSAEEKEVTLDEGLDGRIPYRVAAQPVGKPELVKEANQLDTNYLDLNYVFEEVQRFETFVRKFEEQEQEIKQQQLHAEARIFDIMHAAELNSLNACEGFKLYKLLHEARVQRRQCKDALMALALLRESINGNISAGKITDTIAHFPQRTFAPRALPELFE